MLTLVIPIYSPEETPAAKFEDTIKMLAVGEAFENDAEEFAADELTETEVKFDSDSPFILYESLDR